MISPRKLNENKDEKPQEKSLRTLERKEGLETKKLGS